MVIGGFGKADMSILLDIKIILKTIGVVIFGQGAR